MTTITLEVNGREITADVSPRTHLADFLREQLLLTGTHIGCEHGVCGACTVEMNGAIVRSCITFAVACDGAKIRTIEGFDEDPVMTRLRGAFSAEHALQCGYCTPGMLVAARDLVHRKAENPALDTRVEMSGNLCRCTGYSGIVQAIDTVVSENLVAPPSAEANSEPWFGPAPGPSAKTATPTASAPASPRPAPAAKKPAAPKTSGPAIARRPIKVEVGDLTVADGVTQFTESFTLAHPVATVWELMRDPEKIAPCMPGLVLDGPPENGALAGRMEVKIGPITAGFSGSGSFRRDDDAHAMALEARGNDRKSGSRVSGEISYRLTPASLPDAAEATRVDCTIAYTLQGPLAQFGRSDIVKDLVGRIGEAFAQNVDIRLRAPDAAMIAPAKLGGVSLLLGALGASLRRAILRLLGRGS
ncbi:Carbon monoxide dehydrogenase small chain [Rhodovulum sp. PH10]|uniref:xanthine dehydrogenase family Fe-S subunit n=1 Tax=Rhodovulum sp. PH10 TaxID=1187851 RepID=UPI00027C2DAD|nr:2Fe-2S iron-sulfur cluster-binding protein [Rhodovulum sp. PH10]EJW11058.1 Carbon monoxide dehydrogenase small chain [Rhodovulum sp. PH10]